jgi:hypothetical protein
MWWMVQSFVDMTDGIFLMSQGQSCVCVVPVCVCPKCVYLCVCVVPVRVCVCVCVWYLLLKDATVLKSYV